MLLKVHRLLMIMMLFVLSNWIYCQEIYMQPSDVYTNLLQSVTFTCKISGYSPKSDLVEWCKNSFCTWGTRNDTTDGRLQYKSLQRYYIVGDRNNGEWNLYIENVTLNDEGDFKCTVTRRSDGLNKPIKVESEIASLKIMRAPQSIILLNNKTSNYERKNSFNRVNMVLNKIETFTCNVIDGIPAPVVNWKLNDDTILTEYAKLTKTLIENNNKTIASYTSRLELKGSFNLDAKSLQCFVEHPMLNTIMTSEKIALNIDYAPILEISYEPNDEKLIEGKAYTFKCNGNAKPKINELKLYLNDDIYNTSLTEIQSTASILFIARRNLNNKVVTCESANSISKVTLNKTLNVIYSPQFIETPQEIIVVNQTQSLKLNCKVDSSPEAAIMWLRDNNELIKIGNELLLNDLKIGSDYTCKATNQYYDAINYTISLIIEGKPTITGVKQYLVEKESNLNVGFNVFSSPMFEDEPICNKIERILSLKELTDSNKKNHKNIRLDDILKYSIEKIFDKNNKQMVAKYEFRIKNIVFDDYGVYSCNIKNSHGSSEYIFEVKAMSGNSNLLIIVLAIVLSVLFVLVILLISLIIACNRHLKRQKSFQKNTLPNVSDDISSNQSGNSPNLSVSEWVANGLLHDDRNSDKSSSSQKNLISNECSLNTNSNTNIGIILPNSRNSIDEHNISPLYKKYSSQETSPQYDRIRIETITNYDLYQNYMKVPQPPTASILFSKFQTNV